MGSWSTLAIGPILIALAYQDGAPTPEAFERELDRAQALASKGSWERAHRAWIQILRDHAGADYVVGRLPDIRAGLRNAAFWKDHERPDEDSLVHGDLRRYDRWRGRFSIDYGPLQWGDFEKVELKDARLYVHPALFSQRYVIEFEGHPFQLAGSTILLAVDDAQNGWGLVLGDRQRGRRRYTLHVIQRFSPSGAELLGRAEPRIRDPEDDHVEVRIEVSSHDIEVVYDRKKIFKVKKDTEDFGRVAFLDTLRFEKLHIEGTMTTSWIEGLVDEALQSEWKAFDGEYVEPTELGAWSSAGPVHAVPRNLEEVVSRNLVPSDLEPEDLEVMEQVDELFEKGELREALALVKSSALPALLREQVLAFLYFLRGRSSRAVEHLTRAMEAGEVLPEIRLFRARLMLDCEDANGATKALESELEERPEDLYAHYLIAEILLLSGSVEEARSRIERGLALAPNAKPLLELRSQIVKADQGPPWERSFREKNPRFTVASEYNQDICRLAERELKKATEYYETRLGALPRDAAPVRVFLFGGEAGYHAYIEGVEHGNAESTAGIYSPRLRQILAWNLPDRDDLLYTMRHEAMHAYLDQRLGVTPLWFDEGMSEYYATAEDDNGRWREHRPHPKHMLHFEQMKWKHVPLPAFLYFRPEQFNSLGVPGYAQAWALIHFLRSEPERQALFDRLWQALEGDVDAGGAIEAAFAGVDLEQLDGEFVRHLHALKKGGG